jgi:uncharacterized Zn-finger protein
MKVHNEVKEHKCEHCGKGFNKIYLLQQHLNVHTGMKPFKCTACPKTFASYPNWRKHSKNMHNILTTNVKSVLNENNNQKPVKAAVLKGKMLTEAFVDNKINDSVSLCDNNAPDNLETVEPMVNDVSIDLNNTEYSLDESIDPHWDISNLDPIILQLLEENMDGLNEDVDNINDLHKELWVPSPTIPPGMFWFLLFLSNNIQYHHHQPINVPTAGAQAFLMDYPQREQVIMGPVQIGC